MQWQFFKFHKMVKICFLILQSFLSHKYGYRPCPRTINKEQFEKFLQATENPDDSSLMLR